MLICYGNPPGRITSRYSPYQLPDFSAKTHGPKNLDVQPKFMYVNMNLTIFIRKKASQQQKCKHVAVKLKPVQAPIWRTNHFRGNLHQSEIISRLVKVPPKNSKRTRFSSVCSAFISKSKWKLNKKPFTVPTTITRTETFIFHRKLEPLRIPGKPETHPENPRHSKTLLPWKCREMMFHWESHRSSGWESPVTLVYGRDFSSENAPQIYLHARKTQQICKTTSAQYLLNTPIPDTFKWQVLPSSQGKMPSSTTRHRNKQNIVKKNVCRLRFLSYGVKYRCLRHSIRFHPISYDSDV